MSKFSRVKEYLEDMLPSSPCRLDYALIKSMFVGGLSPGGAEPPGGSVGTPGGSVGTPSYFQIMPLDIIQYIIAPMVADRNNSHLGWKIQKQRQRLSIMLNGFRNRSHQYGKVKGRKHKRTQKSRLRSASYVRGRAARALSHNRECNRRYNHN